MLLIKKKKKKKKKNSCESIVASSPTLVFTLVPWQLIKLMAKF